MPENSSRSLTFQIPITILLDTRATQRALAVENAGQVRELLPVKMESVLTQYRVTRHEVTAHYEQIEQISPFQEDERARPATAVFRVPMEVLMETGAADADEALRKAESVLGAVSERMGDSFARFHIVNVTPHIHTEKIAPAPLSGD